MPRSAVNGTIAGITGIEGQPITGIEIGKVRAIVSPANPADYSAEALSERATDIAWLETMVRGHNDVIAAIHLEETILPATFGSVYAELEARRRALEGVQHAQ